VGVGTGLWTVEQLGGYALAEGYDMERRILVRVVDVGAGGRVRVHVGVQGVRVVRWTPTSARALRGHSATHIIED
jgi:hypothetical protein